MLFYLRWICFPKYYLPDLVIFSTHCSVSYLYFALLSLNDNFRKDMLVHIH